MYQYMYAYMYYTEIEPLTNLIQFRKENGAWIMAKLIREYEKLTYGIHELFTLCHPPFPHRDYKSLPEDEPTFYDFRKNEEVAKAGFKDNYSTIIFRWHLTSLSEPDPYPDPFPYVFGPDPLIRGTDPDLFPDPFIILQK